MGLFIGVLIGLATALTVALYVHFSQLPFLTQQPQTEKSVHTEAQSLVHGILLMQTQPPPTPAPKNTYRFYDMLAGVHDAQPPPAEHAHATAPEKNYLIIGEYLNTEEANNVRARLALSGIEAHIQTDHRNSNLVYRIRVGPFAQPKEAQETLNQLREMGLAAVTRSETP